jgi:SHS2 domain-containing protein
MSFEELPHTADVKIRVHADTPGALFSDACMALMHVMYGNDRRPGITKEISVDAPDIESLLSDFLSEVLYITEVDNFVIAHAEVTIEGLHLKAALDGELFDHLRHNQGTEVKGISYSGLVIQRKPGGYIVEILFDV